MKLYYSNGSPFARKIRVVLAEKAISYQSDIDDRVRSVEDAPGPTLAIPLLEDRGERIWESDVIIDYLLQTYPDASGPLADPPLSPWLARPERRWHDMTVLATIATCASSIVNLRLMASDGITPESSDYMARQQTRVERCLDWLELEVTEDGFAPGWFSIMDIGFICPMVYCEKRQVMPWRGRHRLEALYERHRSRPSLVATPINELPPMSPRYTIVRTPR
jgi:glutathione S-transferase